MDVVNEGQRLGLAGQNEQGEITAGHDEIATIPLELPLIATLEEAEEWCGGFFTQTPKILPCLRPPRTLPADRHP